MNTPPSNNSWIGRLIGDNQRYRLDKRLGGGGMGEVFLATDTRVGKEVALKLLKDKLVASGEMRKRFEREITICAALQSDHIIEISDCGVTEEGYPFYVMEYLRGQTLRQLLMRERRLAPERVVKIMTQVCKGLELAHQGVVMQRNGKTSSERIKVIHRDLKPDNIFLVPTDFGEWVKILDFGIAKIYDESSEQTNLTKTFIGTFRYSSPEQIQNNKNIDVSADIYSLGIILYEMLSAADPFGLSIKGNNISEPSWLLAHSYEPPRPLRAQPGCEQLSLELEAVVLKCLQKKPSNRFASVSELSQALEAAIKPATTSPLKSTTIVQPRPQQFSGGSHNETAPRPLQQSPAGSHNETVPRPLQPTNDETVDRPLQPPQNKLQQGSNQETINKPLQPPSQNKPQQGSNDETINKPLQPPQNQNYTPPSNPLVTQLFQLPQPQSVSNPPGKEAPEGTIMQSRPSPNPSPTVPEGTIMQNRPSPNPSPTAPEGTIMQSRPSPNPSPTAPEGTIMQSRPSPNPSPTAPKGTPEGTIMQPRVPSSNNKPTLPDQTLFQPRPVTNPNNQQPIDKTIMQQHPRAANNQNLNQTSDNTIYQQKPATNQVPQQAPDDTIYQPRNNKPTPQNSFNTLKIVGIALVLALALGIISFFIASQSSKNNNNREAPTSQLR